MDIVAVVAYQDLNRLIGFLAVVSLISWGIVIITGIIRFFIQLYARNTFYRERSEG